MFCKTMPRVLQLGALVEIIENQDVGLGAHPLVLHNNHNLPSLFPNFVKVYNKSADQISHE